MYKTLYAVLCACSLALNATEHPLGIVINPVADLYGEPLKKKQYIFKPLPVAGSDKICPRIHQALFNEIVEIIDQRQEEYHIRISHVFYVTPKNKSLQNDYWTDKKNILPFTNFIKKKAHLFIPKPIDFQNQSKKLYPSIVLIKPWFSRILNMTFSAGTRFVAKEPHTRTNFIISILHPIEKKIITLKIPKSYGLPETERSSKEARRIYNKLLQSWAHTKGFIPYVWGGCSFCYTHPKKTDFRLRKNENQKKYTIVGDTHIIKCGFDCAGIIARAAQIAGLPYYYKNTATLAMFLKPVRTINGLKKGDLIWIPGHVMAVGNIKNGTIIEARHYSQGYGKVHEIKLDMVFKGINNFQELFQTLKKSTPLERLDCDGNVVQKIKKIKILSIESCAN